MKKLLTITVLLVLFATGNIAGAAANWKNLEIYNNTGYTIERLYMTPREQRGVSCFDLLGTMVLYNGEKTTIEIVDGYKYFEMKIVFSNGESCQWTGDAALNLEGSTKIVFSPADNGRFRAKAD